MTGINRLPYASSTGESSTVSQKRMMGEKKRATENYFVETVNTDVIASVVQCCSSNLAALGCAGSKVLVSVSYASYLLAFASFMRAS
jgi:hypothetical protein